MPNVSEIYQLACQSAYMSDGVRQALEGLLRFLPSYLQTSDNISFYSNAGVSTGPVDIDTGVGTRPLVVVVESRGVAGYVRLYNEAGSASVTVSDEIAGDLIIPFATTTGEVTTMFIGGESYRAFWGAGLVVAVSASKPGANARTTVSANPRIYMLYVNA